MPYSLDANKALFDILYKAQENPPLIIQFDKPSNAIRLRRELYKFRVEYNKQNYSSVAFANLYISLSKDIALGYTYLTIDTKSETANDYLSKLGGAIVQSS